MADRRGRVREIADFLQAVRHRSRHSGVASPEGSADLLAWKTSLLNRIAAESQDSELQQAADNARAQLERARAAQNEPGGER